MLNSEPWISVDAAAEHLGVSRDTVYRWIDARGLPAHKVGRFWKLQLTEVDRWVRAGGADDANAVTAKDAGR
jgi:excisionase family DNA binding protein